ncbi:MAG TPA: 2-C-methyl-D-erythritol 4-phosphate cytidylyltransferase [Lachnospiraceae bacterium]|nr:2-C-methyl-D-erythritol 4-phosphate cytidylyltransferase [Lachnospiraceae bacterium]
MVYALILAGGIGNRMKTEKPKQFLMAGGHPVIIHTLKKFCAYGGFEKIIVLCPDEWIDYTKKLIYEYMGGYTENISVIAGGLSRNDTIMKGISYIEDSGHLNDNTIIVTHDAARPFINNRIIDENITAAAECGAATTAVPATDTILYCPSGKNVESITDRSALYLCQTPQTFFAKKLWELYQALDSREKETMTDASGIYVKNGLPVKVVPGEMYNFKITYPNDLITADAYIKHGIV